MGKPPVSDENKVAFIHLLRGVAPLLVMWAHLGGWWLSSRSQHSELQEFWVSRITGPFHLWQDGGHLGVLLFFLVSVFIISYVADRESSTEFVIKRLFRVFPAFWF